MAKAMGISHTSVQRIWREAGLKPHLVRTFKISNDPEFEEKVVDVVGLYMNPPDKALVLCVDEKSGIQALDRSQPGLPLKPGRAATLTHDYKRHGTTTLFAALDVRTGLVVGECLPRHRAKEFLRFLRKIDRATKKSLDLHLVLDNYATHKTPQVKAWLAKHPRFHLHFTPTGASWMNLVERFFAEITTKRIRRGVFRSLGGALPAVRQPLFGKLFEENRDLGFHGRGQHAPSPFSGDLGQWVFDRFRLAERDDAAIVLHGVSLPLEVLAGLVTRHDTPPSQIASPNFGHSSNGFECRVDSQLMRRQKVQTTTQASNKAGDPVQMAGTADHFRGL